MKEQLWPFVEPLGNPSWLPKYLRLDNWIPTDAFLLLIGVLPDERYLTPGKKYGGFVGVMTLDGRARRTEDEADMEFLDLGLNWKMLEEIWASGEHPLRNPPMYYVEWAIGKGFEIPWLPWAEEYGLPGLSSGTSAGTARNSTNSDGSAGRHFVSDKLAKLNQTAEKYWSRADRNDRGTHPKKADVVDWLIRQGFSETLADSAATIIRPEWAPTGRKPEE